MKIIGTIQDKEFLVSMSGDELANLIGKPTQHSMPGPNGKEIVVGMEFEIEKSWAKIQAWDRHAETMQNAARDLRATAESIESKVEILKTLEAPKK